MDRESHVKGDAPKLCDYLIRAGVLSQHDARKADTLHAQSRNALPRILLGLKAVSEQDIVDVLSEALGLPRIDEDDRQIGFVDLSRISIRFLKYVVACPLFETDDMVVLAMADPVNAYAIKATQMAYGKPVAVHIASVSQVERLLERLFDNSHLSMTDVVEAIDGESSESTTQNIKHLIDLASETPVVRLVNIIISRAVDLRASDIHIEPFEQTLKIRYRIDGVLIDTDAPPARLSAAVISRLKIMGKLDIAERRLPQDGRIQVRAQAKTIDLRISTVPTLHGESVVLRILDKEQLALDFSTLGFAASESNKFLHALSQPHGIILVTGPTGSGKTTTLYAALEYLNRPERKILTVEDPIEYQLDGINQIQIKPAIELTFARALRSIVRQDPDVIMIGEMRDVETARIAVQSALTGHLVLSTLHTNDAGSSVTRLLDMGVEGYLIASTVIGILAQRLVRILCATCKSPYSGDPALLALFGDATRAAARNGNLFRAGGCDDCAQTGYLGRSAIYEYLEIDDALRTMILSRADATQIQRVAIERGMASLRESGLLKAAAGLTSIEEVLRVTHKE